MRSAETDFRSDLAWTTSLPPKRFDPPAEEELPEEPWLPAGDIILMTIAAFAIITLFSLFH